MMQKIEAWIDEGIQRFLDVFLIFQTELPLEICSKSAMIVCD
jgi:hypothetical protein